MKKYYFLILLFLNTCVVFAQTTCFMPSISGKLTYDNAINTRLTGSLVFIRALTGTIIDSCIVDQSGDYRFCAVPYGSYLLTAKTNIPWGGVNGTDALLALQHFAQGNLLIGLRLKACDVNASSYINVTDALIITERFAQMMSSFVAGDWVFEEVQVMVSDSIAQTINLKGLCTGDLDGSYIPFVQSFISCGDTLTDQRDLQKYPTVQIGNQCWIKRNLNIGIMVNSTGSQWYHSDCSNNGIIEKYCYNNDPANCAIYGALYDWNEMMQYDTIEGSQGICLTGWHIPTNDDWCFMASYLDPTIICTINVFLTTTIGSKLKESGTTHWKSPNSGATNESEFTGLGYGNRTCNGYFDLIKIYGNMWSSSTEPFNDGIYYWGLTYSSSTIYCAEAYTLNKYLGIGVRCIKNNN